jgi:hypothetical protein
MGGRPTSAISDQPPCPWGRHTGVKLAPPAADAGSLTWGVGLFSGQVRLEKTGSPSTYVIRSLVGDGE